MVKELVAARRNSSLISSPDFLMQEIRGNRDRTRTKPAVRKMAVCFTAPTEYEEQPGEGIGDGAVRGRATGVRSGTRNLPGLPHRVGPRPIRRLAGRCGV